MIAKATARFAAVVMICLIPAASFAQLSAYSQNFGGMSQADPAALSNDGWLVFGNVFDPGGGYLYGYGVFPAPNGGPGFCAVAAGEGGPAQGAKQLVVYSDYNNGDHGNCNQVEANVFQEQTIDAGDVGQTWVFQWDAKRGDIGPGATALAFFKTLDPNNGFALTNFIPSDMSNIPNTWGTYSLAINIDAGLVGQILQFGFLAKSTKYEPSGIFYDNINWNLDGVVGTTESSWSKVKSSFK